MNPVFLFPSYLLKRQSIAMTGKFRIYDPSGKLVLFSQQKMFKLKEDIRVYADENRQNELLCIQARQVMDFSAAYDVIDSQEKVKVGALRRKGFKSIMRDEWEVLNPNDQPFAKVHEDSAGLAIVRRLIAGSLLPQNYDVLCGEQRVADIKQRFNIFRYELDLDFSMDTGGKLDRRLGIAAAILLAAIEGRQD